MMFDMVTRLMSPYQFNPFNFNPLRQVLEQSIDLDAIRMARCPVKLSICATNVRTGKVKVFGNDELSVDAVMASACLPFLFQAVEIDGEAYWDGGYMGNPAIFPLIYGATRRMCLSSTSIRSSVPRCHGPPARYSIASTRSASTRRCCARCARWLSSPQLIDGQADSTAAISSESSCTAFPMTTQ